MKRVIVQIDRLVLKGFRHEDRYAVGEALSEELGRQFSLPDTVRHLILRSDLTCLTIGAVRSSTSTETSQVVRQAGKAIAREVKF